MNKPDSRRNFLKHFAAFPFVTVWGMNTVMANPSGRKPPLSHKFKLSLNAYSFNTPLREGKMDLFDLLDFCAEHNFDAVDPTGYYFPGYPEVPSDEYINEFKRKAFLLGLDISGTGIRNDFTDPDQANRQRDIELTKKWIEATAKLGIPHLRIFAGTNKHEGFTRDQVFSWMTEDIKSCCEYGGKYGVILSIQNHNDFIRTFEDVDRVFKMVDSPWLGLNLDIGSYRQKDPYEEIAQSIDHAVTWQIKENVWIDGKETPTDFVKLFRIIKQAGYRGYLPLETLGEGDPFQKVPRLLENVKDALNRI